MKKRILLINPWIVDFAAYDFWMTPLPLLYLGAILRNAGVDVSLIDCLDRDDPSQADLRTKADGTGNFLKTIVDKPDILGFIPRNLCRYGISFERFQFLLESAQPPDAIMVTCSMTYWYPGAFQAIETVKRKWPGVPVILGGRYATLCPEHAVTSGADFLHTGPIDSRLDKVMRDAAGVNCEFPSSFAKYPLPAHDLCKRKTVASVALSAGCPFRCTYCASHKLNEGHETRSLKDAIAEIENLIEGRGARRVAFCDDALLYNAGQFFIPLLKHIAAKKYAVKFHTPNALHARYVSDEIAVLMKQAGFSQIKLGYESASDDFQSGTGAKVTTGELKQAVSALKSAGFRGSDIGAYIIFGHPGGASAYTPGPQDGGEASNSRRNNPINDIENSISECASLGIAPYPADYSPIPGSEDYDLARASFIHDPAGDPILQNSTVSSYQFRDIAPEEFQTLRIECRKAARAQR